MGGETSRGPGVSKDVQTTQIRQTPVALLACLWLRLEIYICSCSAGPPPVRESTSSRLVSPWREAGPFSNVSLQVFRVDKRRDVGGEEGVGSFRGVLAVPHRPAH